MLFLSLGLLFASAVAASSPCGNANLPTSPVFPTTSYPGGGVPAQFTVTNHWSEVAQMHRPQMFTPVANTVQTNCPHKTGTFTHFSSLNLVANGNPITLPSNTRVLISTCSIPVNSGVFGVITIPSTSELVFNDDGPISIATKGIKVQGGKLLMGSETCRIRNKISITFHGTKQDAGGGDNKGIISVDGTVEMHGQRFTPTWTRLATTLQAGSTVMYVQDRVNWQAGMRLVVTTTELKDSRDYHENEEREITGAFKTGHVNVTAITVSEPFAFQHFAGRAYQAEVALLTRTITLQGNAADSQPTDTANSVCIRTQDGTSTFPCTNKYRTGFGFHVRIEGSNTQSARFSGVEWTRSGQTNMLGRYSLHYHMLGQSIAAGKLYAKDCSVHESYFRAYAIHGTNQVLLEENVAYDIVGHAYFLEDGVEENNTLQYNIGALVHWLGDTTQTQTDSYESQYLFWLEESPSMILPSDSAASVFYITNAYNYFLGNAASGGWAGYGFVNLPKPVKLHQNYGNGQYRPKDRPLLLFKGNTAHSTGYWFGSAGGVYVGGQLEHNSNGVLVYTAGRSVDRDTCLQDPSLTWGYCPRNMHSYMVFQDTKVFLASRGMQHWGQRSEVIRAEAHDVGESMNVFGTVYLTQMLVQCRTFSNTPRNTCASNNCAARDRAFFRSFSGFTWYDVYQNHIMTKTEFRNCNPQQVPCALQWRPQCSDSAVFSMLTHSNQFVPEVMQASREITYTNYDPNTLVKFSVPNEDTVSARLSNWLDMDGSVFPGTFKEPVILGSMVAGSGWWKTSEACLGPQSGLYICPKRGDSAASVYFGYDAQQEAMIGSNDNCPNGSGMCTTKGTVTHFGRTLAEGIKIAQNPKITGPVLKNGGGWYVRFDAGTPRSLKIRYATVHPDDMLLIAVPYPAGTTFQLIATDADQCTNCQDILQQASSLDEVKQAFGDKYYFSNGLLYFRVVQRNTMKNGAHVTWTKQTLDQVASFTREGITLMVMDQWSFQVEIKATNCGGSGLNCAIVPVNIPARTEPPVIASTWAPTMPTLQPTKMPTTPCVPLWGNCHQSCCIGAGVVCEYKDPWWSQCVPGTQSPTTRAAQATNTPTSRAPSGSKAPSRAPTAVPTSKPTSAPSQKPTVEPIRVPTAVPTKRPTGKPSLKPTKLPVRAPTKKPSKEPTAKPTKRPTLEPTRKPSKLPTFAPTKRPSKQPTFKPSKSPTPAPTKKPTKTPTSKPTKKTAA